VIYSEENWRKTVQDEAIPAAGIELLF